MNKIIKQIKIQILINQKSKQIKKMYSLMDGINSPVEKVSMWGVEYWCLFSSKSNFCLSDSSGKKAFELHTLYTQLLKTVEEIGKLNRKIFLLRHHP